MAYKNDSPAKLAFISELKTRGFEQVEIKAQPADIRAVKDGEEYWFEIKLTDHSDRCFGASTQTEWDQALKDSAHYRFVIAIRHEDCSFTFREYTPAEFMQFSTIPPFKVYFNIDLQEDETPKKRLSTSKRKAVPMTEDNFNQMNRVFKEIKGERI